MQTYLQHWEAPTMQGLRAVSLGFSAELLEVQLRAALILSSSLGAHSLVSSKSET
jgi:hypothetical protein